MRIWLINHYAGNQFFDNGGRHYNFAKYLKRFGHDPVIFCCNAKHNSNAGVYFDDNSLWHEHIAEGIDVPFVFVRGRAYVGNGKQRVLNMIDFYRNVKKTAKEYAKEHGKPDVILASSVHPLTLVAGIQLAKHFGVKCICEVRDLWPESIVAYSSRLKKSNPIIKLLYAGEKWIYKKADAIIFTMEGAYDYIIEQGWENDIPREKVHHINNGVDLEVFDYNKEHYQIDDPDLEDSDTIKVVYTGSLREINDIEGLLLAEQTLAVKGVPKHKVLIYGDGDKRKEWEEFVMEQAIPNVLFKGRVDKQQIPFVLSKGDILFIDGAGDSPIVRFGMSQNKMFEYLASNKPIIAPLNDNYNIVEKYGCGYKVDNCAERISEAIELLLCDESIRTNAGIAAKRAVQEYDFCVLTEKFLAVIERA